MINTHFSSLSTPFTYRSPLDSVATPNACFGPRSASIGPTSNALYAQGVTRMQSESADEMSGGLPTVLGTGGEAAGAAGDAASRGARAMASAAESASAGADLADSLKFARGAGRALGPVAVAADVAAGGLSIRDAWKDNTLTERQRDEKVGQATLGTTGAIAGGAGGAWAGAALGATLGSVVPGFGTVLGGVLGAAVGGILGGRGGEAVGEAVGGTRLGRGIGSLVNNAFGK